MKEYPSLLQFKKFIIGRMHCAAWTTLQGNEVAKPHSIADNYILIDAHQKPP